MSEETNIVTFEYLKDQIMYMCDLLAEEKLKEPLDINEVYFLDISIRNDFTVLQEKWMQASGSFDESGSLIEPLDTNGIMTDEEMTKFNTSLYHDVLPHNR